MTYADRLKKYCNDILKGQIISGVYTKKAVERFLSDLKRSKDADFDFFYSQEDADILCSFAESLKPPDMNGKTLELFDWQIFVLCNLEGWRWKYDPTRKRFRDGYIEVNRKNGKTTGILYPLVIFSFLKYPASESYLVSSSDDLANKTFEEISNIIDNAPELKQPDPNSVDECDCKSNAITYQNSRIGFYCADGKSVDGLKPRFAAIDEYHEYTTPKVLKSMTYGMRSKKDAQCVIITTADMETNRPCYEQNLLSKKILNGVYTNESYFCIIYAIDEGDDFHNPKCWQKANPSLYLGIDPSVIQHDIDEADLSPEYIPELKAKTFGIWGGGGIKRWLTLEIVQQHKDIVVNWDDFTGQPCTMGIDLSSVDDFTVYTLDFKKDGLYYQKDRAYIPEAVYMEKYKKEQINLPKWVENKEVIVTPGKTVDYNFMFKDIMEDAEKYKLYAIGYDRWQSKDLINKIEEARPDILLIDIEQSLKKLSPLTKAYEKDLKDGKIVDNNECFIWMALNATVSPDANGNYKPMKQSKASKNRIDLVISSIEAHSLWNNPEVVPTYGAAMTFEELKALL